MPYLNGVGVSTGIHFLGAHGSPVPGAGAGDLTTITEQLLTLLLQAHRDEGTLGRVTDDVATFFRAA